MMSSDNVVAGAVTLETLLSTGWEEDDELPKEMEEDYRHSLGKADSLLNTANEVVRSWDHSSVWTAADGRERLSATIHFTDLHGLAL